MAKAAITGQCHIFAASVNLFHMSRYYMNTLLPFCSCGIGQQFLTGEFPGRKLLQSRGVDGWVDLLCNNNNTLIRGKVASFQGRRQTGYPISDNENI